MIFIDWQIIYTRIKFNIPDKISATNLSIYYLVSRQSSDTIRPHRHHQPLMRPQVSFVHFDICGSHDIHRT